MPLILVPTPLGNLRDITLRAIDELRECDLLVAEDSRVARKLLSALGLAGKEIWSYHAHNARGAEGRIIECARTQRVVLVTDAGMPAISDPGTELVAAARAASISVEVLPGPSAVVSVAALSGLPMDRFLFEGFAPRSPAARAHAFERSFQEGIASVWYDSPQRIRSTLAEIDRLDPKARIFLVREYTKKFEQQIAGTARDVAAQLPQRIRGEIAFAVLPSAVETAAPDDLAVEAQIDALVERGMTSSAIAKRLAHLGYGERRHLYAKATERKQKRGESAGTER